MFPARNLQSSILSLFLQAPIIYDKNISVRLLIYKVLCKHKCMLCPEDLHKFTVAHKNLRSALQKGNDEKKTT